MGSNKHGIQVAMNQLATDLACTPEDFLQQENTVLAYEQLPGRRRFGTDSPRTFKMDCFGHGAVIATIPETIEPLGIFAAGKQGQHLFEHEALRAIDNILAPYGVGLKMLVLAYLPNEKIKEPLPVFDGLRLKWYTYEDMPELYRYKNLQNAVGYDMESQRPDVLAVAAFEGNTLVGAAGASEDAENFWQLGIDVHAEYRGRGIGTGLVTLLRAEVERIGALPYYCTSPSNLFSRNIAGKCGFYPAWVEVYGQEVEP